MFHGKKKEKEEESLDSIIKAFFSNDIPPAKKFDKKKQFVYLDQVYCANSAQEALVKEDDLLRYIEVGKKFMVDNREIITLEKWYRLREQTRYFYNNGEPVPEEEIPLEPNVKYIDNRQVITQDAQCKRDYRFTDDNSPLTKEQKKNIYCINGKCYCDNREIFWNSSRNKSVIRNRKLLSPPKNNTHSKNNTHFTHFTLFTHQFDRPGIKLLLNRPELTSDQLEAIHQCMDEIQVIFSTEKPQFNP